MANVGFIKIHRQLLAWEWFDDHNAFRLFVFLLLKANYKESRYRGFVIPAGSLVAGRIELSQQVGLTEQQTRTAINKLKSTNEITIKSTNNFSIISITNWKKFQDDNQQDNQRITNDQPTYNQRITTSKESKNIIKEEREEKNITKKETLVDENFMPNESSLNVAMQEGFNNETLNRELAKFVDYWKGNGKRKKDWQATFRNWLRNNKNFSNNNAKGQRQEPRSQLAIYAEIANELENKDNLHGEWIGF